VAFDFVNTGDAGATFLVYTAKSLVAPSCYTVEAGKRLKDTLPFAAGNTYDYIVHGPNGFLRRFSGKAAGKHWFGGFGGGEAALPDVAEAYDVANGNLQLHLKNSGTARCTFSVKNAYAQHDVTQVKLRGGDDTQVYLDLRGSHGWYDVTITVDTDPSFTRRLAGHVETGKSSMSDPALGA
jgi:phospholipase C